MKLLERYIARSVLVSIGLVTVMLAGLQLFILFVNQLDDLGRNDFGIAQAFIVVMLQMPYQVYLFFPVASLLGCLIGLGVMANYRELIVMRAAGLSIYQITFTVLKAAVLLILVVTLIGETLVPKMARYANDRRVQALTGGQALRTARGVWLRYHNDFISIGSASRKQGLEAVVQFKFNDDHELILARKIASIRYEGRHWQAYSIEETRITGSYSLVNTIATMPWDVNIKPGVLNVITSEPDEMSLPELVQYLHSQKKNHQNALSYQLAFWQRVFQPAATIVMMILAIPFIFGPLRSSTMGSKLLAGAAVGFGFHLINRFFGPLIQVLQWPPLLAAVLPILIFALLGFYLMRRVR